MRASITIFPGKLFLARTYAKGVPKITVITVAKRDVNRVRVIDRITVGSVIALISPSGWYNICLKIILSRVNNVKRMRIEPASANRAESG